MSLFSKLFHKKSNPFDVYRELRTQALSVRPDQMGSAVMNGIIGFVMDIGLDNGTVTIVALADGTVSMYTSTGGGMIGLGPHPGPKRVAQELLLGLPRYLSVLQEAGRDHPLPPANHTSFWVLGEHGLKVTTVDNRELLKAGHPLLPLYAKAQDLITAIRQVDERLPQYSLPPKL